MAGPYAEAFRLIGLGPEKGLIDYRSVAGKVGACASRPSSHP